MSAYTEYFLNSPVSVAQLELIEISHPNFTKVYRLVRNANQGVTVTLETSEVAFFEYIPLKIAPANNRDDLDQAITITFGDLGEILPMELEAVMATPNGLTIKPVITFWVYRSDNLTVPLYGPIRLSAETFSFDKEGATFEAKAASLNVSRTGEVYLLNRFPMLRGFL